jgi:hypothetical protein
MTKIEIAKRVLATAASLGSGKIVHEIVKNNVTTTTQLETVTVAVGSFAIGGAVANVAKDHMNRTVDEVVAAFHAFKSSTPSAE